MADNTGNTYFNGQLDPSWMGAPGAAPKVLPNQTSPWQAGQAAAPYGMSVQMLAVLGRVGNPQQRQWAQQEMFRRAGDPTGGTQTPGQAPTAQQEQARQQFDQWDQQYGDDPNVGGAMAQLMQGKTPQQVMQIMTGPGGNGLQGVDPNAWMQQINTMQNALTGVGIGADPTHGYSANSPFNPQNTNSPFYGSSAAGFGNPTSTSVGNNPTNAANAAGTGSQSPGDIAYQNQLRQTVMDSPTYNPNGANTWGIQNGTAANLAGAFGGGVINPSAPSGQPAPAQPQIPGGPTSTATPYMNSVTPGNANGQGGVVNYGTPPSGTQVVSDPAMAGTSLNRTQNTPSYFGGALGGSTTPPAPSAQAPSPATTAPAPTGAITNPFGGNLRTSAWNQ